MPASVRDTIFALSSGPPPAAIGVVRISGPRAGGALKALTGKIPAARKATLAQIRGTDGEIIDQALALWFPGPHSETGEDVAELQLHGGRAVIAAVLSALSALEGLRPAEAGEFTRRAFENGKLDLTGVEGLADLVMAETDGQRRQAFRQLTGALRQRAESWRSQLIQALALIEVRIDFSDEADVPEGLIAPALQIARRLEGEIASALTDEGRGERLREGLVVAIAGPPNAGKSTLLNRFARREAAIVSPHVGTTRDVIEVHLDLAGLPVTLLDTAGIRETDDPVELEGVRRARARAGAADVVLWVVDASNSADAPALSTSLRQFVSTADRPTPRVLVVRNKIDLLNSGERRNELRHQVCRSGELSVQTNEAQTKTVNKRLKKRTEFEFSLNELEFVLSALSGEGFDALLAKIQEYAGDYLAGAESALITRARHRQALADALGAVRRALARDLATKEDLLAEELRIAARALERLLGRVDVEDILEVIFRDFCIGK
ncbi:MAG TPA: tRNA uridine-5-carboxymethylaminomethyl(34) synthesis GTPase MnmE [Pseudolabrys sp.]|nr:tRNA uridine-5-carboxymethylaminomethyl(34) synthesis GTPase MnmE [Pseudolabrys sp.]